MAWKATSVTLLLLFVKMCLLAVIGRKELFIMSVSAMRNIWEIFLLNEATLCKVCCYGKTQYK